MASQASGGPRVGVILSGCGVIDGSEIHEAVSLLIALDRRAAQIICMAPNVTQAETIDHLHRKPMSEPRNVLVESARIARGKIKDLATVTAADVDALVFPGGFGAAKNLSTFAREGAKCSVNEEVARLVRDVHKAGKPIGLACIAPVIAARLFGAAGIRPAVTIGTDVATARAIEQMGGRHVNTEPTGIHVDEANRLVTTPCYMNDVGPWTVYQGADALVEAVLRFL
jgi:enhancing lycopene biosynthesis protein 2